MVEKRLFKFTRPPQYKTDFKAFFEENKENKSN
jgi:hypothetical protein